MDPAKRQTAKRPPLAETNPNVPALFKKAKTEENHDEKREDKSRTGRLAGDELREWQLQWRKIMRESIVYFDTLGCDSANGAQLQELRRAQRALKLVGCEIAPFYDRKVSIIVSRRLYSPHKTYAKNDIFSDAQRLRMTKVWDYDKVFRFLRNLGVLEAQSERENNLSHLLKEEKIFGLTDRDPSAKRDDLHYFEKSFVHVYDLSQQVRPIAVREWSNESYPAFHLTLDGKCPFVRDSCEADNLEKKRLRRMQKFEANREYRELLKRATQKICGAELLSGSTDPKTCDTTENDEPEEARAEFEVPNLVRQSSLVPSVTRFYDVAASGFNGASNAVQFSMDSALNSMARQGNGLGPTVSQVPSKNLNNLKRRIFLKRHQQSERLERDARPGYCENCRTKYDNFDQHIQSNRHRNFACNDENFEEIDKLIAVLGESKSMGYVASNGDYSFA